MLDRLSNHSSSDTGTPSSSAQASLRGTALTEAVKTVTKHDIKCLEFGCEESNSKDVVIWFYYEIWDTLPNTMPDLKVAIEMRQIYYQCKDHRYSADPSPSSPKTLDPSVLV